MTGNLFDGPRCRTCGDERVVETRVDVDVYRERPCPACVDVGLGDRADWVDDARVADEGPSRPGDPDWADPWERA